MAIWLLSTHPQYCHIAESYLVLTVLCLRTRPVRLCNTVRLVQVLFHKGILQSLSSSIRLLSSSLRLHCCRQPGRTNRPKGPCVFGPNNPRFPHPPSVRYLAMTRTAFKRILEATPFQPRLPVPGNTKSREHQNPSEKPPTFSPTDNDHPSITHSPTDTTIFPTVRFVFSRSNALEASSIRNT